MLLEIICETFVVMHGLNMLIHVNISFHVFGFYPNVLQCEVSSQTGSQSQVLETLRSVGTAPKPFALKEQYIPAVAAARAAAGVEEAESEDEAAPGPSARKRKSNPGCDHDQSTPWNYADVKNKWIDKCRIDQNVSFKDAKTMWESSDAKRNYLKHVSLKELKRRKFLPKGATTNPWSG